MPIRRPITALGATIGHEIGHGFDDQGRKFDAAASCAIGGPGEAAKKYTAHADALVKQYKASSRARRPYQGHS